MKKTGIDGLSTTELDRRDNSPVKVVRTPALDLAIFAVYALILIALAYAPVSGILDLLPLIGIIMLFFIPGYLLLSMYDPVVKPGAWIEQIALSVGISSASTFIITLFLSYFIQPVQLSYTVVCLSALSLPCILIMHLRRCRTGEAAKINSGTYNDIIYAARSFFGKREGRAERFVTAFFAVLLLALVLTTAYITIMPKQGEKFTEFYLLGPGGKAENYPLTYALGDQKPIIVGISNHEYRNVTYDLVVMLNDSGNFTQIYARNYSLVNNQTLEKTIMLKPDHKGEHMKMEFWLYADGNMTAPYRELYLQVSVT